MQYDHTKVEKKWQEKWDKVGLYKVNKPKSKIKKFYNLVELTYTSGDLHIGHWFAWSAPDAYARFKRMSGYEVLFPVGGFDAFGLPAENAAIKHGIHPKKWTFDNIKKMREQFATMGPSFDWDREVITADPDYYRWTQWLFLKLYEEGLAYKAKVASNWCPECKTVLANEHVENGCCWRHTSTKVEQKEVEQWLIRITDYADKLIWPAKSAVDWPREAIDGQNNWIGRKEGINITYKLAGSSKTITVFTTTPVNFGATYLIVAPEYAQKNLMTIVPKSYKNKVSNYVRKATNISERQRKIAEKERTGIFTGLYAINHVNGEKIPVWVTDFVLMEVGTGAVQGCPGHDKKDFEFAQKYKIPIKRVIVGLDGDDSEVDSLDKVIESGMSGKMINSEFLNGMEFAEAMQATMDYFEKKGWGKRVVTYHLRDWTISRQRYWGVPIPIIYCDNCGIVPVPEEDLPVVLPEKVDYTPTGKAPLATAPDFINTKCPKCRRKAKRDPETMDTYVDSSWYFLRYPAPKYAKGIIDPDSKAWLPLDMYFGGPEHILGHTLYARFITKFLHELGVINFDEFAAKRRHHGIILGPDGYRMSKSRGNVVNPDEQVKKFGADAVRLYLMFLGPHGKGGIWSLEGMEGMGRFLKRVWNLVTEYKNVVIESESDAREILVKSYQTIQRVAKDIEELQFNTAIASIMEFVNLLREKAKSVRTHSTKASQVRCAEWDEALRVLTQLLAPFAPHIAEELWVEVLGEKFSVHTSRWPKFDMEVVREEEIVIAIQVNGKLRGQITVASAEIKNEEEIVRLAKSVEKVNRWLVGGIKDTIFIPGKIVNFVTNS